MQQRPGWRVVLHYFYDLGGTDGQPLGRKKVHFIRRFSSFSHSDKQHPSPILRPEQKKGFFKSTQLK
jgi:hypothetical protein